MRTTAGRTRLIAMSVLTVLAGARWVLSAQGRGESWIAVVSTSACGAMHSEGGHADCIRKCNRGGAAIGHPEWKPQPLVLVRESDHSVWSVDNDSSLKGFEGQRVKAEVAMDAEKKSVHVTKVAAAEERKP